MRLIVEVISLLLIGVGVGAYDFSDYRRQISFSDSRFIRANEFGSGNNSWIGFAYALCTYAEGDSQDVNCTIVIEKPTSDDGAKTKLCQIRYSREEELELYDRRVENFDSNWAKLIHLDENRLVLTMPMNGTDLYNDSAVYSFVNMDTCKIANRYWLPQNNKERIGVLMLHNYVWVIRRDSKICGNLRQCSVSVDFDGNEKADSTKLTMIEEIDFDGKEEEQIQILQAVASETNGILSGCIKMFINSLDYFSTTYNCRQKDYDDTQKLNTIFHVYKKSTMVNVYNLPIGGLLAFTTDCGVGYNFNDECDTLDVHKISKDGFYEGYVTVKGMQPNRYMEFSWNDDELCMFATYTSRPSDQKTKDHATFHGKCIKNFSFFKSEQYE